MRRKEQRWRGEDTGRGTEVERGEYTCIQRWMGIQGEDQRCRGEDTGRGSEVESGRERGMNRTRERGMNRTRERG